MKIQPSIIATLEIKTTDSVFLAHYSKDGLARLDFPGSTRDRIPSAAADPAVNRWHKLATRAVAQVLQGRAVVELPPLDLSAGSDFQRNVWQALLRIPAGKTETYSQIAAALSQPKAARAVGGACGANPIPLLVPCHRVVAAGGGLGGFSGGLHWKKKLLALENPSAQ